MKAIILDLDGVIVDSEPLHVMTIREIFSTFGIEYSMREHARRFAGTGAKNIIGTVFKEHGIRTNVDEWVKLRTQLYQQLLKTRKLKPIAGVREFVRAARRQAKIAVASGGHLVNVTSSLKAAGLKPSDFSAIITVENAPKRKPNPQIFLKTARTLHARPSDCTVFEDSIAGVEAAKRAKMRCVALLTTTTKSKLRAAGADLIVKDFRDKKLRKWLAL